ncbi:TraB/GumN family protein [Allomuricauda sp. NBRC 101325]|uniref:TraB/GumN family protein n=1 Tax=Allomuricauda sp. NBRC 101325 TaxID=1113758 RepID=UPI0024A0BA5E|nr:TraB/GumN family protein [Muricauda sp. NBRC 101325]GLU44436.1 hypothetical protein Musp01_20600 [Muricauda sp. NBRC 101325]
MRIIRIVFGFIFLGNLAYSRTSPQLDSLRTNTVLYKITTPNHSKTSYIFGTHHALDKPFFDSLQHAKEALIASELLIKENLNIPGHLSEDIINKRSSTTKWKKYLDQENLQYVVDLFAGSKLDFKRMTPAELYAFLGRRYKETVCVGKDSTANYFSLDDYIASLAYDQKIEVIGLETTEEQLQLINEDIAGMPNKVHKRRLTKMIERIQAKSQDMCSEIDWYTNMDFDFKLDEPCRNDLVLKNRNEKWMVQLTELLKTNNCFIVVGLSHLMFECGLLNQLEPLQYHIEPIQVK